MEEEKYQEYTASLADYKEKCTDRLDAIAKEEKEAEEVAQRAAEEEAQRKAAEESAVAEEAARVAAEQEEARRQQEAAAAAASTQPAQVAPAQSPQAPAVQPSQPAETQPAQQAPAGNSEHNINNVRNLSWTYETDEAGNEVPGSRVYTDVDTGEVYDANGNYAGNIFNYDIH